MYKLKKQTHKNTPVMCRMSIKKIQNNFFQSPNYPLPTTSCFVPIPVYEDKDQSKNMIVSLSHLNITLDPVTIGLLRVLWAGPCTFQIST